MSKPRGGSREMEIIISCLSLKPGKEEGEGKKGRERKEGERKEVEGWGRSGAKRSQVFRSQFTFACILGAPGL